MSNLTWLYVGLIYTVFVGLARRANVELPRRVAVLFYGLVLVFLWRPMTQDYVLVAADVIKLTPPWSEMRPPGRPPVTRYEVSNLNMHDVPMQIIPWQHQVRESWRNFDVPLWNPSAGSGYPLLANGQSTPLSPLRLLTQPLSLSHALTAECAMKLLCALVLTYLFCRRRYSRLASVVAAITYAFSTWMTTWLQFPIAAGAALLPGVLLVIDLLIERVTRQRFLAASLMFAVTVLAGHPETVYQIALIAAAYGLWVSLIELVTRKTEHGTDEPRQRSPLRGLLGIASACIVAALISSPFLVPFAEAVVRSQRFAEISRPRQSIIPPYSDFYSAVILLQPRFFGHLPIQRPWGPTNLETVCGFAGALAMAATIAAAIYIALRRRWRDRETLYVLGVVLSVGVVLAWPGITELFHAIAGAVPAMRMRLGICWFSSLLVAAVMDWSRRETRVPLLAGVLAVGATMFWLLHIIPFPTTAHRDVGLLSLLPSIAVLAAVAIFPPQRSAIVLLAALIFVELSFAISNWHPRLMPREMYPATPIVRKLQELNAAAPARVLGTGGQLYPNAGAMFGIDDVRVHDPMAYWRYVELLTSMVGWQPKDYYAKWNDTSTSLLDFLNVGYVVTEPDRELQDRRRFEEIYAGRDGRIYANRDVLPLFYPVRNVLLSGDLRNHTDWRYTALVSGLPRSHRDALTAPWIGPDARVKIISRGASRYRLHVRASRPTLIVSSITNWPGWRAGGLPVVEVNGVFFGFVVPAGEHEIDVSYRPLSFWLPAAVALLTLVALLMLSRRSRAARAR